MTLPEEKPPRKHYSGAARRRYKKLQEKTRTEIVQPPPAEATGALGGCGPGGNFKEYRGTAHPALPLVMWRNDPKSLAKDRSLRWPKIPLG